MQARAGVLFAPFGLLTACITPRAPDAGAPSQAGVQVVWDGDVVGDDIQIGRTRGAPPPRRAQHWQHCEGDGCVATLAVTMNGRNGSHGLEFHGEGSAWMGFGFAWAGWSRRWAPRDVSHYARLSFWLRAVVHSGSLEPLSFSLHGPDQGDHAGSVSLAHYLPNDFADGQWHQIVVPLAELAAQEHSLDLRRVWDIGVGSTGQARSFDLYLDEIAFEGNAR